MYRLRKTFIAVCTLSLLFIAHTVGASSLPEFTKLVEEYGPAVVNISTKQNGHSKGKSPHHFQIPDLPEDSPFRDFLDRFLDEDQRDRLEGFDARSLGSGFIISEDGYIMTNHHVVRGADEVLVRLADRREFVADIIGSDKQSDVALIKIDAENLPVVKIGKSANVKVGEWVAAIGSPFGFDHSVTAGIVSAKGRSLPNENYVPFIQTDVAINPGNSGGPLFNLDGEVIGINSQIYSRSGGFMGLSFAIPIEMAMNVVDQLRDKGYVTRGYLGVLIQDVTRDLADSFGMKHPRGALVARVMPDSPAQDAGLQPGDVILSFNGHELYDSSQLPPLVGASPVDKPAELEILRGGERQNLKVSVGILPEEEAKTEPARLEKKPQAGELDKIGLVVRALTSSQREEAGIDGDRGVLVEEVGPGPARQAGIRRGDIVLMINNQDVSDVDDFRGRLDEAKPGKTLALLVQRNDGAIFLAMRMPRD